MFSNAPLCRLRNALTRIAVIGLGNVGLANAVLLARQYSVAAMDIKPERVAMVNDRACDGACNVGETLLADALGTADLDILATTNLVDAVGGADFVLIATPTDFDPATSQLETGSIERTIKATLAANPTTIVVIRSTIPVGFVEKCRTTFDTDRIIYCPEFLRQDHAYFDSLHPSRIVVGDMSEPAARFAQLLADCAADPVVPILLTSPREAEAIKLFSNTYLAMRVAFFNELDSFALSHDMSTARIINGVGLDPRIGQQYNTPSFGCGGYCLPKDSQQLLSSFADVPQSLMQAVVDANQTRIDFLVASILRHAPSVVGVYRPDGTSGDKWSNTAELGLIRALQQHGLSIVLYGLPSVACDLPETSFVSDLAAFKTVADLILCDRQTGDLQDVAHKVWTRDPSGKSIELARPAGL